MHLLFDAARDADLPWLWSAAALGRVVLSVEVPLAAVMPVA